MQILFQLDNINNSSSYQTALNNVDFTTAIEWNTKKNIIPVPQ